MPKYKCVVKDSQGKTITEESEAFDRNSLVAQLQKKGYFILSIEDVNLAPPKPSAKDKAKITKKFTRKRMNLTDMLSFARQLATLLEAGVTLLRSLEVILEQTESSDFHKVITKIVGDIEQGSSLSEAMAKHPRTFNPFWVSLVEVGEASGTMPMVLNKLAFYLEQQAAFNSTIISSLMYPVILFFICIGAVSFFALFVGPRFETVFTSMGVKLPLITRILLVTFRIIKEKFFWIVLAVTGLVFFLRKWTQTRSGRYQTEKFLFSLPTLGEILKLIVIERFTSQMAILVDSGVPILLALGISERLVDNLICADVIANIKESVRQGELLVAPMERSRFLPPIAIQMISVGEETGELSKMLNHVAKFYQETVETFMKRLGTLIEPFMLVFMGAVIGVIVLAMFLPMFNISQLGGAKV